MKVLRLARPVSASALLHRALQFLSVNFQLLACLPVGQCDQSQLQLLGGTLQGQVALTARKGEYHGPQHDEQEQHQQKVQAVKAEALFACT